MNISNKFFQLSALVITCTTLAVMGGVKESTALTLENETDQPKRIAVMVNEDPPIGRGQVSNIADSIITLQPGEMRVILSLNDLGMSKENITEILNGPTKPDSSKYEIAVYYTNDPTISMRNAIRADNVPSFMQKKDFLYNFGAGLVTCGQDGCRFHFETRN